MSEKLNENDIRAFFQFLGFESEIEIRAIDPNTREAKSIFVKDIEEAVKVCKEWNGKRQIYAGINKRYPKGTMNIFGDVSKGTRDVDVKEISIIPVDIDVNRAKGFEKDAVTEGEYRQAVPEIFELYKELIERYGTPFAIKTGNGILWLWKILPIALTKNNFDVICSQLKCFQEEIMKSVKSTKFKIDSVGNPSHVVRVPGTLNTKGNNTHLRPYRLAKIIKPELVKEIQPSKALRAEMLSLKIDTFLQPKNLSEVKPLTNEEILHIINRNPTIKELYQNGSPENDRSSADFAITSYLIKNNVPKHQIKDALLSTKWSKLRERGNKYFELTYANAYKEVQKELGEHQDEKEGSKKSGGGNSVGNSAQGDKGCRVVANRYENYPFIFNTFLSLIKLYGKSYNPIKKAVFYSLIGNTLKSSPVRCCNIEEDTRINLFIPLRSGYGKKELEEVIKRSVETLDKRYSQPTSHHPEQLIGKTVQRRIGKDIEYIQNYGYLHDDFLCFDEALQLFRDKNYQQSRDYICKALDPIGKNEIQKRGVDILPEDEIKYIPNCSMVFFFQPLPLDAEVITRGFFRRGLVIYTDIPNDDRRSALKERLENCDLEVEEKNWEEWVKFLRELLEKKHDWTFSQGALKTILNLTLKDLAFRSEKTAFSRRKLILKL